MARKVHKDLRYTCKIGERKYGAKGFLEDGENPVTYSDMMARVNGRGNVVGLDDYEYITDNWPDQFFPELLEHGTWLVTGAESKVDRTSVICFVCKTNMWYARSRPFEGQDFDKKCFVLLRIDNID